ncbi:MAG: alpha/beta fold hydrolase [Candidatus Melainabacteria bacterium]|nr:MAG: alpha/beta fold hydrolase [Candidatus Melainabacteria bacterium]
MAIKTKSTKAIYSVFLSVFLAIVHSFPTLADECTTIGASSSTSSIGARCTAEPSCVIVGETHMLEWKSPNPAKIIVVCIHGLGLCARAYKPLAQELSIAGIDGFGVNVRGFGPDRVKTEYAKLNCLETVGDVNKLLLNIHKEHPDFKVYLIGESMGGALAIRIAAENPTLVNGVICSAPAWKLLKMRTTAVKGVFELFLFQKRPGFAARGVIHQATKDKELSKHWLSDPSHKLKLSLGEAKAFLGFISKTDEFAKQLEVPILIVQGLNDHLVSAKAVSKLFKDIPSEDKTFLIDGKGEHLILEEGNFSPAILERLIGWIKTDEYPQSKQTRIEVINDQTLTAKEKRDLFRLKRLATGIDKNP